MKATMSADGGITITPESGAEAFALSEFVRRNLQAGNSTLIQQDSYAWKANAFRIACYPQPEKEL